MDWVSLLPLIKVIGVFTLVVVLLRLSVQVGVALAAGAVAMGLLFAMGPWEIVRSFGSSLADQKALILAAVITLILILSGSLERLGQMEDLLGRFRERVGGRRWGLVAFPALIGLLPMPGGAYFSAPMLDAFDPDKRLSPGLKSFLNYWYRHVWEYWWPLFPAVILTCTLAEFEVWRYTLFAFPLTLVALAGGVPHLMRVPRRLGGDPTQRSAFAGTPAWRCLMPMALAIVPGVGFGIGLQLVGPPPPWASLPRELGLVVGLLGAVIWSWTDRRARLEQIRSILLDPKLARMWVTVAGVFVFKGIIERSGAAQDVGQLLLHLHIPVAWVAVLLPMIVGIISGLPIAYVGASFPIIITLITAMGLAELRLPFMILAFVSGFTGSLLSPMHLCLILSNEYFSVSWTRVYRYLWLPSAILLAGGIGYFWILRSVLP